MRKKIILIVFLCLFTASPVMAFLYEVKIMANEDLKKIKKEELIQLYTDAIIEREASETFHGRAGFSPKEYQAYKELLGLIVRIRQEMAVREIDAPPVNEWLK